MTNSGIQSMRNRAHGRGFRHATTTMPPSTHASTVGRSNRSVTTSSVTTRTGYPLASMGRYRATRSPAPILPPGRGGPSAVFRTSRSPRAFSGCRHDLSIWSRLRPAGDAPRVMVFPHPARPVPSCAGVREDLRDHERGGRPARGRDGRRRARLRASRRAAAGSVRPDDGARHRQAPAAGDGDGRGVPRRAPGAARRDRAPRRARAARSCTAASRSPRSAGSASG